MKDWIITFQILAIIAAAWLFYKNILKNTAAEKMVRGLFGLVAIWIASFVLIWVGLDILGVFLRWTAIFMSLGLIVVFQPELRKFLVMMGDARFLRALFYPKNFRAQKDKDAVVRNADEIVKAVEYMSHKNTGALIVFRDKFDGTIEKIGTKIDAEISSELLLTIFHDKTPLHDGAVVISNGRILYAGAILPLTQKSDLNWRYGTRHRAAIGMSEQSESKVLVVSEETGQVAIAERGKLTRYEDMKKLRMKIEKIIG
jgi:diadenylate cyclase